MGRIEVHNREVMASAEYRANQMDTWPSPLEERMKQFLDDNYVEYESQKVFYIYADDGWIIRYYIADFFIPHTNIIIEVRNMTKLLWNLFKETGEIKYYLLKNELEKK